MKYLNERMNDMALPDNPISRNEQYLSAIAGQETDLPDYPITREEQYLAYIAENGGGGLTPEQEAKLDAALVTPATAPTEKELVGVGTANEQIMFKVGDGLEIEGATSPFTLKATGASGGVEIALLNLNQKNNIPTGSQLVYINAADIVAALPSGKKFPGDNISDYIVNFYAENASIICSGVPENITITGGAIGTFRVYNTLTSTVTNNGFKFWVVVTDA